MPTGYTAGVQDGKITKFSEFAWQCARAFRALIEMRDDPSDAPIPEELKPSPYYREALDRSIAELAKVEAMTEEECDLAAKTDFSKETQRRLESAERKAVERKRYDSMLEAARDYRAPSPDHVKFREFMIQQLVDSISFDCGTYAESPIVLLSGADWKSQQLASIQHNVTYYRENLQKELDRTDERNRWLKQLRDSLPTEQPVGEVAK